MSRHAFFSGQGIQALYPYTYLRCVSKHIFAVLRVMPLWGAGTVMPRLGPFRAQGFTRGVKRLRSVWKLETEQPGLNEAFLGP